MTDMMDSETYQKLREALANAHPEDFINLVSRALMDREDTDLVESPSVMSAQFIVPGGPSDIPGVHRYADRRFTVVIRHQDVMCE